MKKKIMLVISALAVSTIIVMNIGIVFDEDSSFNVSLETLEGLAVSENGSCQSGEEEGELIHEMSRFICEFCPNYQVNCEPGYYCKPTKNNCCNPNTVGGSRQDCFEDFQEICTPDACEEEENNKKPWWEQDKYKPF